MSFLEILETARAFLERRGRVSFRALQREFELDDDALEELIEELVEIQRVAVRDERALAWAGDAPPVSIGAPELERAPRDYTPKHLADKILRSRSALEGERKQVTVMFADMKGSMDLAEQVDPEVWHGILDRFLQILSEGVHRFEGTVNQYTGDGVMALFGAPIAHEDHAQRACYAALWLKDALQSCSREVKREHGLGLLTRIGLHSGEVVVGRIGDDLRMDYTAQGHTVGMAQRMESLAEPNTAYLSGDTAKLVSGYFDLEDLGVFQVKGAADPVEVFHLRGIGELQSRFQMSRARGLSRFVGRGADMQTLESALEQAQRGNGQVVGIVAEAGTGKSRLCFEFLERCQARGLNVIQGHAVAHGKNIPLLPMLQIFRAYFGIMERDDERSVREKIAGRLLLLDTEFGEFLPVLFELFGVPDPDRSASRMDPDVKQRQIFAVIRKIVQGADPGIGQGVALLEDLHWMDAPSEAFLEQWVDAVAGSNFLLLVNFRPEYNAKWMSKSYYRQIPLAPLGPEAVRDLLDDLLGRDPSIAGLAAAIHGRTGGNPFFTEEVVQGLIESEHLEGAKGAYRLVTPIERLEVPATVRALLSSRIDRLPEREKAVLQTAAVIGKEFAAPILVSASEFSPADVDASIRSLKEAEFVYEQSLYPVAEYAFKHPLTQEVALGSQLQDRRRRTHAAVAEALEEANATRLEEAAALLAHHWEEAGENRKAARWHRRAAAWAGLKDGQAALDHWRRVRALVAGLEPDAEGAELRIAACSQILALAWRQGASEDECRQVFEDGRASAQIVGDLSSLASLTGNYAGVRGIALGHGADYVRLAVEAARIADEAGDLTLRCAVRGYVVYAYRHAGLSGPGIAACRELEELAGDDLHVGATATGFSPLLGGRICRLLLECYSEALDQRDALTEACQLAVQHGYPEMCVWGLWDQVQLAHALGREEDSLGRAREAISLADHQGINNQIMARSMLGFALAAEGNPTAQLETMRDLLRTVREQRVSGTIEGLVLRHIADAHLALGQPEEARQASVDATKHMANSEIFGWALSAFGTLARAQLALGEPASAVERTLDDYAAVIERTGMRVYERELSELRSTAAVA